MSRQVQLRGGQVRALVVQELHQRQLLLEPVFLQRGDDARGDAEYGQRDGWVLAPALLALARRRRRRDRQGRRRRPLFFLAVPRDRARHAFCTTLAVALEATLRGVVARLLGVALRTQAHQRWSVS